MLFQVCYKQMSLYLWSRTAPFPRLPRRSSCKYEEPLRYTGNWITCHRDRCDSQVRMSGSCVRYVKLCYIQLLCHFEWSRLKVVTADTALWSHFQFELLLITFEHWYWNQSPFVSNGFRRAFQGEDCSIIEVSKRLRACVGTTVTVHNLFHNMPVRRRHLDESLEFEKVCVDSNRKIFRYDRNVEVPDENLPSSGLSQDCQLSGKIFFWVREFAR